MPVISTEDDKEDDDDDADVDENDHGEAWSMMMMRRKSGLMHAAGSSELLECGFTASLPLTKPQDAHVNSKSGKRWRVETLQKWLNVRYMEV